MLVRRIERSVSRILSTIWPFNSSDKHFPFSQNLPFLLNAMSANEFYTNHTTTFLCHVTTSFGHHVISFLQPTVQNSNGGFTTLVILIVFQTNHVVHWMHHVKTFFSVWCDDFFVLRNVHSQHVYLQEESLPCFLSAIELSAWPLFIGWTGEDKILHDATQKKMSSRGTFQCTTWLVWNKLVTLKAAKKFVCVADFWEE